MSTAPAGHLHPAGVFRARLTGETARTAGFRALGLLRPSDQTPPPTSSRFETSAMDEYEKPSRRNRRQKRTWQRRRP